MNMHKFNTGNRLPPGRCSISCNRESMHNPTTVVSACTAHLSLVAASEQAVVSPLYHIRREWGLQLHNNRQTCVLACSFDLEALFARDTYSRLCFLSDRTA